MNPVASLSQLTKVSSHFSRKGKSRAPRKLHPSQCGLLSPTETPDDDACGLFKNLTCMTTVRFGEMCDSNVTELCVRPLLQQLKVLRNMRPVLFVGEDDYNKHFRADIASDEETIRSWAAARHWTIVVLGTRYLGVTSDSPAQFAKKLRELRTTGIFDASIIPSKDAVCLSVDEGQLMRPVFVVDKISAIQTIVTHPDTGFLWDDLCNAGCIQYLTKAEEDTVGVANRFETRHELDEYFELDASCIISSLTDATHPFPEYNQAPRNVYHTTIVKQAVATPFIDPLESYGKTTHSLTASQRPLYSTLIGDASNLHDLCLGQNVVVAITTYGGANQEDAVIVNRAATQRGLFQSACFRSYYDREHSVGGDTESFGKSPQGSQRLRILSLEHIDDDGFPKPHVTFTQDHALFGKFLGKYRHGRLISARDRSTNITNEEPCRLASRLILESPEGKELFVKTVALRNLEVGDKIAGSAGQKSVVGVLMSQEDMPFSLATGTVPDIIINPHSVPSRMLCGYMRELLFGKCAADRGTFFDATPFADTSHFLESHGFKQGGTERFCNGQTGEIMKAHIYVGVGYYFKQRHMVQDKLAARSVGPVTMLTRQAVHGRNRGGGFRFGNMEADVCVTYGASQFLRERLVVSGDAYLTSACPQCGEITTTTQCRHCPNRIPTGRLEVPYALKLLQQELRAAHINMQFELGADG